MEQRGRISVYPCSTVQKYCSMVIDFLALELGPYLLLQVEKKYYKSLLSHLELLANVFMYS